MNAQLKERAQVIANLSREGRRKAGVLPEIKEVYTLLTGQTVECTWCNVDHLVNAISQKLIQQPLNIKFTMATKGHFKSGHEDIQIIRHTKNGTIVITSKNLNEGDNFEWVSKQKEYAHNVAETKAKAEDAEPAKTAAKTTTTTPAKK